VPVKKHFTFFNGEIFLVADIGLENYATQQFAAEMGFGSISP
jgi:hypothetical protein